MWQTIPQRMWVVFFAILTGGASTSWHFASAQLIMTIPIELQGMYMSSKILMHFCPDGRETCMPSEGVRRICCAFDSNQCSNDSEPPRCMEDDQVYVCGYRDAIVCQYEDGRGSCIYSNSSLRSIEPLCVCKENGMWPTSDNHTSQIGRSCKDDAPTTTVMATFVTHESTLKKTTPSSSQATSSISQSITVSDRQDGRPVGQVNIATITLGVILALVVLIVVIAVVLLRKRGTLPAWMMKSNHMNPSGAQTEESAPDDSRLLVPVPLVPNGGEYAYAEVTPVDPAVHDDDNNDHNYSNLKSNQKQKGGLSRFAKHGSPGIPNPPTGNPPKEGGDRKAPKLPTKNRDSVHDYEIPDVKTTTDALSGVAAIGAVDEVSSGGLPHKEEPIGHTYFERK